MKRFAWLSLAGAIGAACIALAANAIAEHFLSAWKSGQAGWFSAAVGYLMALINQLLLLPARVLSAGSDSSWALPVASVISFCLWGVIFAFVARRLARHSGRSKLDHADP